jgi:hypothetical protein
MAGRGSSKTEKLEAATDSRPARVFARTGLIASGILHVLIGVIAIRVGVGLRDTAADQSGALAATADVPGGTIAIAIAAVGLIGLAVWQWTGPMAWRPEGVVPNRWRDRVKSLGYLTVGLVALAFTVGGDDDAGSKQVRSLSGWLIEVPGGLWILAALGVGVGAVGVAYVVRGVTRRFREDITVPEGLAGRAVLTLGIAGHVGKGLALLIVGAVFVGGAFLHDSRWTSGLDGAIKFLMSLPTGALPIGVISAGFIAHGGYLMVRAGIMRR